MLGEEIPAIPAPACQIPAPNLQSSAGIGAGMQACWWHPAFAAVPTTFAGTSGNRCIHDACIYLGTAHIGAHFAYNVSMEGCCVYNADMHVTGPTTLYSMTNASAMQPHMCILSVRYILSDRDILSDGYMSVIFHGFSVSTTEDIRRASAQPMYQTSVSAA